MKEWVIDRYKMIQENVEKCEYSKIHENVKIYENI